ncbi:MAG: hypothetical protein KA436_08510 [Oligoflexales bacterium]|nr:hypothetical protein [Oligoflexales bacterium]
MVETTTSPRSRPHCKLGVLRLRKTQVDQEDISTDCGLFRLLFPLIVLSFVTFFSGKVIAQTSINLYGGYALKSFFLTNETSSEVRAYPVGAELEQSFFLDPKSLFGMTLGGGVNYMPLSMRSSKIAYSGSYIAYFANLSLVFQPFTLFYFYSTIEYAPVSSLSLRSLVDTSVNGKKVSFSSAKTYTGEAGASIRFAMISEDGGDDDEIIIIPRLRYGLVFEIINQNLIKESITSQTSNTDLSSGKTSSTSVQYKFEATSISLLVGYTF